MEKLNILDSLLENKQNLITYIVQEANNKIPIRLKKYLSNKKNRQEMYLKYGDNAFLEPDELKYPVYNPKTGTYDCQLLLAAYLRAAALHNDSVQKRAKNEYDKNNCKNKTSVTLNLENSTNSTDTTDNMKYCILEFLETFTPIVDDIEFDKYTKRIVLESTF